MYTRLQLITSTTFNLAKGLIIGIRYGVVREQFKTQKVDGKIVERKIMDYQTHIMKYCPIVSFTFGLLLVQMELYSLYNKMLNNIEKNQDFSLLGPIHTILSGLKALVCNNGNEDIKKIRESCGAAGFSKFGGLGLIIEF
jgi:hypothetical protein